MDSPKSGMYRTSSSLKILCPTLHFTVPTPRIFNDVLPSPRTTDPVVRVMNSKTPLSAIIRELHRMSWRTWKLRVTY
jgi:hypothetical protein